MASFGAMLRLAAEKLGALSEAPQPLFRPLDSGLHGKAAPAGPLSLFPGRTLTRSGDRSACCHLSIYRHDVGGERNGSPASADQSRTREPPPK
jgi:hypothetical protein